MSRILKVVGIDPSLRNFGFAHGVVDLDSGEIIVNKIALSQPDAIEKHLKKQTRKNSDDLRRARYLSADLMKNTEGNTFAMVEVPVGSQSARSMASYGICVGVLAACKIPIIQVTPAEVKLMSVGHKQASKAEMIEWAMNEYPDAVGWKMRKSKGIMVPMNDNEHMADACAAIHAGVVTEQFAQAASLYNSMVAA